MVTKALFLGIDFIKISDGWRLVLARMLQTSPPGGELLISITTHSSIILLNS